MLTIWKDYEALSLRDAAKEIGISHSTLARIENGEGELSAANLVIIANWIFAPASEELEG